MRVEMKPIKWRRNPLDYTEYEREIRAALEDARDDAVAMLDDVTLDWEHEVTFQSRLTVTTDKLLLDIYPTGPNAQIFKWVDQGTRDHWVAPVRAKQLSFQTGYMPHTTPGGGLHGPGKATGPWAHSRGHMVSGIEPREFTAKVAKLMQPIIEAEVRDAIREASQ